MTAIQILIVALVSLGAVQANPSPAPAPLAIGSIFANGATLRATAMAQLTANIQNVSTVATNAANILKKFIVDGQTFAARTKLDASAKSTFVQSTLAANRKSSNTCGAAVVTKVKALAATNLPAVSTCADAKVTYLQAVLARVVDLNAASQKVFSAYNASIIGCDSAMFGTGSMCYQGQIDNGAVDTTNGYFKITEQVYNGTLNGISLEADMLWCEIAPIGDLYDLAGTIATC